MGALCLVGWGRASRESRLVKEQRPEIPVVGDGTGGVAVALGCRMVLTEETDWIGGQLT